MFQPKDLIHLVFADETDTYYSDDLLQLNLNQKLWMLLHRSGYSTVYFLRAAGESFAVRTFGDAEAPAYTSIESRSKFIQLFTDRSAQDHFTEWFCRRMREKTAFVCSLEDFCSVFDDADEDSRRRMKELAGDWKRKGILVLTTSGTIERSKPLLLHSKVFELLNDTAVLSTRGGESRSLYRVLRNAKGDACVFLNTFSREAIRSILLQASLRRGRALTPEQSRAAEKYLYYYLRDEQLQQNLPLFERGRPMCGLQFRELYTSLAEDDQVWDRLLRRSQSLPQTDPEAVEPLPLTRDQNSVAARCIRLRLPKWAAADEENRRALQRVQQNLRTPKNQDENEAVCAGLARLCGRLEGMDNGDVGTCRRLLTALTFCEHWLYVEPGSETEHKVLENLKALERNAELSVQYFRQYSELRRQMSVGVTGVTTQKVLDRLAAHVGALEKFLEQHDDVVKASILNLSLTGKNRARLQTLEQDMARVFEEIVSGEPEPAEPEPVKEPARTEEPEEIEYDLHRTIHLPRGF